MNLGNCSIFGFLVWLCLIWSTVGRSAEVETKTFVAYSMRVAQERVEAAMKAGEDFRKKQPDLYYLGGITRPWAVVIDANNGDWILVGERDPKCSVLTLDDWVTALRARFIHPEKDPGVTIDPRPCEECLKAGKKEACRHYTKQDVRFFAGIENTHFGQVCFEADWLMKKVGLGLEKLPVEKLRTYYDLSVEQARNSGASRTSVGSRFWFYPIVNRVNVLRDVVLLEKFEMGVFTEVLYAEVDGKPVADLDRFEHYPSESFSRSFSDNYDAASQAREVLETLRGLTRLAALAKGLTQVDLRLNLGFYITGYLLDKSKTPQEADVLKVENQEVGFEISGGVDLMALVTQIKEGDASALKKLVLRGRSERTDLTWAFGTVLWQDQPADVKLLQRSPDLSAVMSLFQQAVFLEKKLRYAAAIECYSRIIDLEPRLPELYCRRGVAYAHISDYESAITDYDRALSLEANYANAYNNRGIAYRCKGNYDQALADYTKALSINPSDAAVYTNRGVAYQEKKDFDRAIADHNEAIRLDNSLAQAYNNRGTAYYLRGEKERAIADYDRAIALGLSSPEVYVNRGMAYYTTGQYSKAAADLTEAIARNPYDAELYFVSGNAYRKAGNYREAIRDYDKVVAMTPDRAEAYLNRGLAYADGLHDYLRAIRDYDSAISLLESFGSAKKSDLALAYNARGGAYGMAAYLAGDDNYSRSLRDIEKALLLDPQLLEAYFNKAQILEKAHKSTEAMQYYRKYISMAKNGMKLRELNKDYADKLLRQAQEALRELER